MLDLRVERDLTYLFITHDLSLAWVLADRIAVMYLGRIVELGPASQVIHGPRHPYTSALVSVAPSPEPPAPGERAKRTILAGETPDASAIPAGCRLSSRCPLVFDRCPGRGAAAHRRRAAGDPPRAGWSNSRRPRRAARRAATRARGSGRAASSGGEDRLTAPIVRGVEARRAIAARIAATQAPEVEPRRHIASGSVSESEVGGGVSFDSLATLMSVGAAYIDIHTRAYPTGLIRGQLTSNGQAAPNELFAASALSGAKERPTPVLSTATGTATFEVRSDGSVKYNISVAGLTGAIMAHIHAGVADSAGPIVVPLFNATPPTGPITGTLASGSFTSTNIQIPGISLDSLLTLMRTGRTYVNVHTEANPGGEIRAQIEPVSVLP